MRTLVGLGIALSVLVGLVTGCTTVKITSWTDPAFAGRSLGKTMVIGVSESESVRRQYEELFAKSLGEAGVEAVTSVSVLDQAGKVSQDEMLRVIGELKLDSIVVTRVTGEKDKVEYHAPGYPGPSGNYYGFYNWSYSHYHAPGYVSNYTITYLETNLYDTETEKLVWSGRKAVTDHRSERQNMEAIVKAVVGDLRKQGFVGAQPAGRRGPRRR